MIIAKTTMEYLPSSCMTCDFHFENDKTISCFILKEFKSKKELKNSKKFRFCPLEKIDDVY